MATHSAFMSAWHSTRLSFETHEELDRHALKLAKYADEATDEIIAHPSRWNELKTARVRVAELEAALRDERERCARVCEEMGRQLIRDNELGAAVCLEAAARRIREGSA